MPITALELALDREHYSRYEPSTAVLRATVTPTPNTEAGTVGVEVRRQAGSGELVLATQSIMFTTPGPNAPASVAFDLGALLDAHGLPSARLSRRPEDYQVVATLTGSPTVSAARRFTLTPFSVETLRARWLFGLPLFGIERLHVRLQPQLVTGVMVVEVGRATRLGAGVLAYTASPKTLSWAGGPAVSLQDGITRYVLPDLRGGSLVVDVPTLSALPGTSLSETLYVDYAPLTDAALVGLLLDAAADLERGLRLFLEPTRVVTRLLTDPTINSDPTNRPEWWDVLGEPVTWYKPPDLQRWLSVKLPHHGLLRIQTLQGWFNQQKIVTIPPDWITWTEKTALVELVPSALSTIQWIYSAPGFYAFFMNQLAIPQFWHYDIMAGLREVPQDVAEFLAMRAAIRILTVAGQARYPAGVSSVSISRDGVSESRGLNPQGVYAATIRQYQAQTGLMDGRDVGLERLRDRYLGLSMMVL